MSWSAMSGSLTNMYAASRGIHAGSALLGTARSHFTAQEGIFIVVLTFEITLLADGAFSASFSVSLSISEEDIHKLKLQG